MERSFEGHPSQSPSPSKLKPHYALNRTPDSSWGRQEGYLTVNRCWMGDGEERGAQFVFFMIFHSLTRTSVEIQTILCFQTLWYPWRNHMGDNLVLNGSCGDACNLCFHPSFAPGTLQRSHPYASSSAGQTGPQVVSFPKINQLIHTIQFVLGWNLSHFPGFIWDHSGQALLLSHSWFIVHILILYQNRYIYLNLYYDIIVQWGKCWSNRLCSPILYVEHSLYVAPGGDCPELGDRGAFHPIALQCLSGLGWWNIFFVLVKRATYNLKVTDFFAFNSQIWNITLVVDIQVLNHPMWYMEWTVQQSGWQSGGDVYKLTNHERFN